jgi:hypothetical protein
MLRLDVARKVHTVAQHGVPDEKEASKQGLHKEGKNMKLG